MRTRTTVMPTNCLCLTRRLCKSDCHYLAAKINFCRDFLSSDKWVVFVITSLSMWRCRRIHLVFKSWNFCSATMSSFQNGTVIVLTKRHYLTCRSVAVESRTGGDVTEATPTKSLLTCWKLWSAREKPLPLRDAWFWNNGLKHRQKCIKVPAILCSSLPCFSEETPFKYAK